MKEKLFNVILLSSFGLLFIDNISLRTQLSILRRAGIKAGIDIDKLADKFDLFNARLLQNEQEDEKFREQQAKFDRNVITVFEQRGLLKGE